MPGQLLSSRGGHAGIAGWIWPAKEPSPGARSLVYLFTPRDVPTGAPQGSSLSPPQFSPKPEPPPDRTVYLMARKDMGPATQQGEPIGAVSLPTQTPPQAWCLGVPLGLIKVHTTGRFLAGREEGSAVGECQKRQGPSEEGQVGKYLLKPGLMRDSPGHRLLTPAPGLPRWGSWSGETQCGIAGLSSTQPQPPLHRHSLLWVSWPVWRQLHAPGPHLTW